MNRRFAMMAIPLLVATALPVSAASISLNFEHFAYGTDIGTYYSGGRDSLQRASGNDYGLTFSGGTVKYTPSGAYLAGPVELSIDVARMTALMGTDRYYLSFNAARYDMDGGYAYYIYADGSVDGRWIAGNGNPGCGTREEGCGNVHYGRMDGYRTYIEYSGLRSIHFNTDRLDNIQFHAYSDGESLFAPETIMGSYKLSRDIPEPASLALLGIGSFGLIARRRRQR